MIQLPFKDQVCIPDRARLAMWQHEGIGNWYAIIERYLPGLSQKAAELVLYEVLGYPLEMVDDMIHRLERLRRQRELLFGRYIFPLWPHTFFLVFVANHELWSGAYGNPAPGWNPLRLVDGATPSHFATTKIFPVR